MSATPTDKPAPAHRPFSDWLFTQRGGNLHEEVSAALAEVSAAVADTGLAGSVTLTVNIKPLAIPGGASHQLVVQDTVSTKVPKRPNEPNVWFLSDEEPLGLQRDDPRQMSLALVELRRGTEQLRELGDGDR